tara:strand:+ start:954 stop:5714 length:4761 start_codon:yes stop_codon:yes gene_type:complete
MSYSTYDPAEFVEDSQTLRTLSIYKAPTEATRDEANRASSIVAKYPTISSGSLVGAVKMGISDEDPRLKQIVLQEVIAREDASWNPLKSAIRKTFMGFQNLWELGAARGVRYLEGRQQGMSHEEASQLSYASFYDIKEKAIESGRGIDEGTGWFLGGTDPTTTPEYKNLLQAGVDPAEAREFVLDNVLGVNIFEEQRKKAETGIQFTGERAEMFRAAGLEPTVTIGRWLFKPVDEVIEPGTDLYNNLTGMVDILAQIFLDPVGMTALGVSKVRKLGKGFTGLKKADNLQGVAKLFEETGMLQGARKTIFGPTVKEFLAGNKGLAFKKYLYKTDTSDIIAASKENIKSFEFYDALREFKKIHKGKSFDEIDELFTKEILNGKLFNIGGENLLMTATSNVVPGRIRNNLSKMLEKNYGPLIKTENASDSLVTLNRFFRIAFSSLDEADRVASTNRWMNSAMDALKANDKPTEVANLLSKFMKIEMERPVVKVLTDGKTNDKKYALAEGMLSEFKIKILDEGLAVAAKFVDSGVATKNNLRSYAINRRGENLPITNVLRKLTKRKDLDSVFELVDPVTVTQLADEIFLPDPIKFARAAKALDGKLNKIGNKLLASESATTISNFLDLYYSKLFKPLVLLRPAWTVRVIAEEQIRLLSSGVTTVINHPAQLIARAIGKPLEASKNLLGSWANNAEYLEGMNNVHNLSTVRRGYAGTGEWSSVSRSDNKRAWSKATFRNFMQHKFDPLSRRLAQAQLKTTTAARTRALNKVITDVQTKGHILNKHVKDITAAKGHAFNGAGRASDRGKAIAEEFVHYANASVAQVTGGIVETATTRAASAARRAADKDAPEFVPRKANQWVEENGKTELLEDLLNDDLLKAELEGLENVDATMYWDGDLKPELYDSISSRLAKNQIKAQKQWVKKYIDILPEWARGELSNAATNTTRKLDDFVNDMFKMFMTIPTQNLSRAPTFKYHYWAKVGDYAKHTNQTTLNKIRKAAKEAGLNKGNKHERKIMKKLESYKGVKGGINDMEVVDKISSSFALGKTKDLLYDVTTRSRLGSATRGIFPFGEAFVEIFTTWARIIGAETGRPIRRFQQVVQAAQKPSPVFDDSGQKGYFYKDPNTNKEMFGYPGEGLINKWMFKELNENGVYVNLPVFASSLNIAGNLIPGVGPTITVPAAFINRKFNILRPGKWEEQILFGDFSPPRTETAGEILASMIPEPAWAKKFRTAFELGGEDVKRQFSNTTIEVYKALLYAGRIDDSTPQGADEGIELAGDYARKIFLIRFMSQAMGPSGAVSPKYEMTDETGQIFLFETLAEEYRNISNSVQDDYEAVRIFTERFGFDPIAIATSKTQTIKRRPVTEDGARWVIDNPELVDKFDLTYSFLIDETDSEFMYQLYYEQLLDKDRVPRTPEQWQQAKNILLGNIEFERFVQNNNLVNASGKVAIQAKRNKKAEIAAKYPGYGRPITYSMNKPTQDEVIEELYTWINPVTYSLDPALATNPAARALSEYLKVRDEVIAATKKLDPTATNTSFRQSNKFAPFRALLRDKIKVLLVRYPEFGSLSKEIFERELREADEDIQLLQGLNE